jgi:hypothetical protein
MMNKQLIVLSSAVLIALSNGLSTKMLNEVAGVQKSDLKNLESASYVKPNV